VIANAARLGDAKGDDVAATKLFDAGLTRFVDAPPLERARGLLYRAELAVRLADRAGAAAALDSVQRLPLNERDRHELADEIAHAEELVAGAS
jgi:hypothetical protein